MAETTTEYLKDKDGNLVGANDFCTTPFSSKLLSNSFYNKYIKEQECRFCLDSDFILTPETCCTGCSKLKNKEM